MSKELAQTVGGKRTAWLIAILAAFAVFATVATQWRGASADVATAEWTLSSDQATPAQIGDVVNFTLTAAPLANATLGAVEADITLPAGLGQIFNISSSGLGGSPSCPVTGANNNQLNCTWAQLASTASGTLTFSAVVTGPSDIADMTAVGDCSIRDQGSAQIAQVCTFGASIIAQTVEGPGFTVRKDTTDLLGTVALDPVYLTERFVYQISIFNTGTGANDGAEDFSVTDTLPAQVDAIGSTAAISGGGGPAGGAASCSVVADVVSCTGLDFDGGVAAPAEDTSAPFASSARQIVISVQVQMRGDAGGFSSDVDVTGSDVSNTGTATCQIDNVNAPSAGRIICDDISGTDYTLSASASDTDLTPWRVVLVGDSVSSSADTCDINTSNWNLSAARAVGNVTSLALNGVSDYTITPGTYTGAAVTTVGSERRVSFTPTAAGTYTVVLHWNAFNNSGGGAVVDTPSVTCAVSSDGFEDVLDEGLYHVTPDGGSLADYRDDPNNLIGFVHQVCLVPDLQSEISYPLNGIIPPSVATGDADDYFWRIVNVSGTTSVTGQSQVELDFPQYQNGEDLPCVRWYSTGPGEQEITVVNGAGEVIANWFDSDDAFDSGDPVGAYEPLVKEWNLLDPTYITDYEPEVGLDGIGDAIAAGDNLDGDTIEVGAIFNPATSEFEGSIDFWENVLGSHQSVGGTVPAAGDMLWVDGARVTFTISGACGAAWVDGGGWIYVDGDDDVTVTSLGQPIGFTIDSDGCSNADLSTTKVTISVDYPTNIGSISPVPPADETITVHWTTTRPTKHVLLAWAGQRILLEHDWRLPPGDISTSTINTYTPDGSCPFGGDEFAVDYVRGSGPGNFVAGLGASQYPGGWRDGAHVHVSTDDDQTGDAPTDPQGACISRVIYESEDEGQVDIEAFADPCGSLSQCSSDNQTKIAFVIYYMKIEKVSLSFVTGNDDGAALVKKPKHNATGSDFAPGNPWRYDNDLTAAEQNVSTDVLVRVLVKGWFLTSNPSGRERDATDPNNVLPQDRWVMPDDWARLIAGGAGIDFRPEYDYMFAPNNTKGITLDVPDGTGAVLVTKVAARTANSTTSLKVDSLAQLPVGAQVKVSSLSNTTRTVIAVDTDTNVITLSGAVASSTPAAGASVWVVSGVPFEGPFSLIDIQDGATGQGLFGQGFGSAALSNIVAGAVRDTRNGDQVLDWYDAPMPSAPVTVDIRKAGFLKQVLKKDVYYTGTADSSTQDYPNPYYYSNIPESPYLPSSVAGGSYLWDSWGNDGPNGAGMGAYEFWEAVRIGVNISGNAGETLTTAQQTELAQIRAAYGDATIARRLVVFSDNHGEAMVIANGDFNLTYDDCAANLLGGGKHCDTGDLVGKSDVFATADYPDFRGKHAPVRSNTGTIDWTWGGYKTVTIEPGEVEQFVYVVFRALDRDGFCDVPSTGTVSLHPVLSSWDDDWTVNGGAASKDPIEAVDFLIDSDEGGIIIQTSSGTSAIDVTREATKEGGLATYSTATSGRSETASDSTRKFAPLDGATQECQAWIKLSNSLLGVTNVLVFAHDDEGLIGFDKIVDFNDTVEYTLNFRWSLITWMGADNIAPADALGGTGANDGGTDILDEVTAVYGWEASSQSWLAFFPDGVDIPGANDLTGLRTGNAYWIAIEGPSSITWSVVTNVD